MSEMFVPSNVCLSCGAENDTLCDAGCTADMKPSTYMRRRYREVLRVGGGLFALVGKKPPKPMSLRAWARDVAGWHSGLLGVMARRWCENKHMAPAGAE